MKRKLNLKKGSALVTTIVVALLVCILITTMLTLSMYDQNLATLSNANVTRQNRFDMLTDMFLRYNVEPAETFGYHIEIHYFENGSSVMTVRSVPGSSLCDMVVEQRDGDLVKRYYNVPYEYGESTPNRTIGIHNEKDQNPYMVLSLPASMFSGYGDKDPFYIYGKIKVERAVSLAGSGNVHVQLKGDGGKASNNFNIRTAMSYLTNTNGWMDLTDKNGGTLSFTRKPVAGIDHLEFIVGMSNLSGDVMVGDLIITDKNHKIIYSLANDSNLHASGDVRQTHSKWTAHYNTDKTIKYTTQFPIVTKDPDNYIPQRVIAVNQHREVCSGEAYLGLYKHGIREADGGTGGWYYITGRIRVTITGTTEVCHIMGDNPVARMEDYHSAYDRDPTDVEDMFESYLPDWARQDSVSYYKTGNWVPILNANGGFYSFYVPPDCEEKGDDFLKFTLWAAQGDLELADIRIYRCPNQSNVAQETLNPKIDKCVYDMTTDNLLKTDGTSWNNCPINLDTQLSKIWYIHFNAYEKNVNYQVPAMKPLIDKADKGSWKVSCTVNPNSVIGTYDRLDHYNLPVFPNKVGQTYNPNA